MVVVVVVVGHDVVAYDEGAGEHEPEEACII